MTVDPVERLQWLLGCFIAKDVAAVVGAFAADGALVDPHYPPPIGPAMVGHAAIQAGMEWAMGMLEQPGFTVRNTLAGVGAPHLAAAEVDTSHRLVGGMVVEFPQLFVAEIDDAGLFRRLQSYVPYPPPPPPSPPEAEPGS